ncbi:MAG: hypothetical protein LWX00_09015 [Spirochaetia bacterium]|nr:hypothetical protein [Spirochaetia bacterium]
MNKKEPQVLLESLKHYGPYIELRRALESGQKTLAIKEAELPFLAMTAAALYRFEGKKLCVVVPTDQEAENFIRDMGFFNASAGILPWWQTGAYRSVSVRSRIFGERVRTLADLVHGKAPLVVASVRAFMTPVPPRSYLAEKLIILKRSSKFDPEHIADRLSQYGYLRVPRVSLPGEYALRGEVLDLYMPGDDSALRIQFEFDMIEKITAFDPGTQTGFDSSAAYQGSHVGARNSGKNFRARIWLSAMP